MSTPATGGQTPGRVGVRAWRTCSCCRVRTETEAPWHGGAARPDPHAPGVGVGVDRKPTTRPSTSDTNTRGNPGGATRKRSPPPTVHTTPCGPSHTTTVTDRLARSLALLSRASLRARALFLHFWRLSVCGSRVSRQNRLPTQPPRCACLTEARTVHVRRAPGKEQNAPHLLFRPRRVSRGCVHRHGRHQQEEGP